MELHDGQIIANPDEEAVRKALEYFKESDQLIIQPAEGGDALWICKSGPDVFDVAYTNYWQPRKLKRTEISLIGVFALFQAYKAGEIDNACWQDVRPPCVQSQPEQPASKSDTSPVTIRYNLREDGVEANSASFKAALKRLGIGEAAFFYLWRSHSHPSLIVSASASSDHSFDIHCLGYGGRENKVYRGKEHLTQDEAVTIFETFCQGSVTSIDWQAASFAKRTHRRLAQIKRQLARRLARQKARQKVREKALWAHSPKL
jgi:hypothetical protein